MKKKDKELSSKPTDEGIGILYLIEMALAQAIDGIDQPVGQHDPKKCEEGLAHLLSAHDAIKWAIARWDA
ncbi:MAG: hypothetical protein ACE5KK_03340 [Candidatus Brocadiales bacterium]